VLSRSQKSYHTIRGINHKPNLVKVYIVEALSDQGLVLFTKDSNVDTRWDNQITIPRHYPAAPRVGSTRALAEPNPAKSGNNDLIHTELEESTDLGFGQWTSRHPFPRRLTIEVDIT
jgi:hypothetical protein